MNRSILSTGLSTLVLTLALAGCEPLAGTDKGEGAPSAPADDGRPAPTTPQPEAP